MINDTKKKQLAQNVLQLRYWQLLINEALKQNSFSVPVHMAIGHEAIAVAIDEAMTEDDQLILTHRNIEYNLIRCGSINPVIQAYRMSPNGIAEGKLGSMNLAQPENGITYTSSILGNNLPVAAGIALAKNVKDDPGIVIVLTGDGAMEEGSFYESLIFSKSHNLPILIIIENNDQAMSSNISDRRSQISVSNMCRSVDVPYWEFRSNNIWEYSETLSEIREIVSGKNPVCLEVHLKAITNHAGATPGWPLDQKIIDIKQDLIVEDSPSDPVFVLKHAISSQVMAKLLENATTTSKEQFFQWTHI